MLGAVVLAAGSGSRLGGRPKCLLELEGVPLIVRTLLALKVAGIDQVVMVTGHHAESIEPEVRSFPVILVRNLDPDAGLVASQRLGLAALTGQLDAVLVALADQPLLTAPDFTTLLDAWRTRPTGAQVLYPEVVLPGGVRQRGNPVLFSAGVRAQILAGPAHLGCRQWQAAHPEQVAKYVTNNPHFSIDIDTADDMARLVEETGIVLNWPKVQQGG